MKNWLSFALLLFMANLGRSQSADDSLSFNLFKNDLQLTELKDTLIPTGDGLFQTEPPKKGAFSGVKERFFQSHKSTPKDSLRLTQATLINSAEIQLGSAYGGLALVNGEAYRLPYYFSEGSMSMNLMKMPVQLNYYVSDLSYKGGRANRFTLKLDTEQIRKNRNISFDKQLNAINHKRDSLKALELGIDKKIAFNQFELKKIKLEQLHDLGDLGSIEHRDSLLNALPNYNLSSSNDSIAKKLAELKELSDQKSNITSSLALLDKEKAELQALKSKTTMRFNVGDKKIELPKIKQLAIGNASPSISSFTLQNSRLFGVSTTLESERVHIDFAVGKFSPLFGQATRNPLERFKQYANSRTGSVICIRGGLGPLSKSHLYLSFLGGRETIKSADEFSNSNIALSSKNVELEGQVGNLNKGLKAKMGVRLNSATLGQEGTNLNPNFSKHVSAYSLEANYEFTKIQLKSTSEMSWVGPGYYTVGNPFLRNDQINLSSKLNWSKFKMFSPGIGFRFNQNNVLNLFDQTNSLSGLVYELTSQPSNKILLQGFYSPTEIEMMSDTLHDKSKIDVYGVVAAFHTEGAKSTLNIDTGWNRNIQLWNSEFITTESSNMNIVVQNQKGMTIGLSGILSSYNSDTISSNLTEIEVMFGAGQNRTKLDVRISAGQQSNSFFDYGINCGIAYKITDALIWQASIMRIPQYGVQLSLNYANMTMTRYAECRLKWNPVKYKK